MRIEGMVSQFFDRISSVTSKAKKAFKSNKYTKKVRSKEAISQSVRELVSKVKDLNSMDAIKASFSSIA